MRKILPIKAHKFEFRGQNCRAFLLGDGYIYIHSPFVNLVTRKDVTKFRWLSAHAFTKMLCKRLMKFFSKEYIQRIKNPAIVHAGYHSVMSIRFEDIFEYIEVYLNYVVRMDGILVNEEHMEGIRARYNDALKIYSSIRESFGLT